MPLKDFECQSCHHKFEVLVWIREPDPAACPKCGAADLKQLLGTFRVTGLGKKSQRGDAGLEDGEGMGDESFGGEFDEGAMDGGFGEGGGAGFDDSSDMGDDD